MKIAIIGAGYVGLVTAACLSSLGHTVGCIDKDPRRIAALMNGRMPIYEPGLEELVTAGIAAGHLFFGIDALSAVPQADICMIAVGTPTKRGQDAADLTHVYKAAEEAVACMKDDCILVVKSTVPAGTAAELEDYLRRRFPGRTIDVASNPEFLRQANAVEDFMEPDRIVAGTATPRAAALMRGLYAPLTSRGAPLVLTSREAAELIKYAANTYLATRIGFVNQLADLCEAIGADVLDVTRGMGLDRRIGCHYLNPGPGLGGSCFPKDTRALAAMAKAAGVPASIVENVISANDARKAGLASRVAKAIGSDLSGKHVAVLGVAFKAGTDDVRDSAALALIPELIRRGATVAAHDPAAMEMGRAEISGVRWCRDALSAAEGADALVVLTEWPEFRNLDLTRIARRMQGRTIVDFRNMVDPERASRAGFAWHGLGRPSGLPVAVAAPGADQPARASVA